MVCNEVVELAPLRNNMLLASQLEAGSHHVAKEEIDLTELTISCVNDFKIRYPLRQFKEEIDAEVYVMGDNMLLQMAINNLIDNALKYGGNKINIELISTKNKVEIFIKDNGNGIHKDQKEKIFEQFYRIPTGNTHNVKGFGIGLYYTKNIIEKHGGNIHIIYDKKNHTIFKIELLNE